MNTTHSSTWLNATVLLMIIATTVLISACSAGDNAYDLDFNASADANLYNGRCTVDGSDGGEAVIGITQESVNLYSIPYDVIMSKLFPDATITQSGGSELNRHIRYRVVDNAGAQTLLSLYPPTWTLWADVDGTRRIVELSFVSVGKTEEMSWGTISKNGVLTLILSTAAYTTDGHDISTPVPMKITYTMSKSN